MTNSMTSRSWPSEAMPYWRWTILFPRSVNSVTVLESPAPGLGAERLAVEHDLPAVEFLLALAKRHPRLAGIGPHAGERSSGGVESDQPQAGRFGIAGAKGEFRLQEPAAVDHRLATLAGRLHGPVAGARVEDLFDVPVADELGKELLPGARPRTRLDGGLRIGLGAFGG